MRHRRICCGATPIILTSTRRAWVRHGPRMLRRNRPKRPARVYRQLRRNRLMEQANASRRRAAWRATGVAGDRRGGQQAWRATGVAGNRRGGQPAWRATGVAGNRRGGQQAWRATGVAGNRRVVVAGDRLPRSRRQACFSCPYRFMVLTGCRAQGCLALRGSFIASAMIPFIASAMILHRILSDGPALAA